MRKRGLGIAKGPIGKSQLKPLFSPGRGTLISMPGERNGQAEADDTGLSLGFRKSS